MKRSVFAWAGSAAVVAIVVASILVRQVGPADLSADVAVQREAITRFHELVISQSWGDVYGLMTEPPAADASAFADLMQEQVNASGEVVSVKIEGLRLLRSRTVPLLEVHESVTTSLGSRSSLERVVSYYAHADGRWLFAFSAPADAGA